MRKNVFRILTVQLIAALLLFVNTGCNNAPSDSNNAEEKVIPEKGAIVHLTDASFKEKVFDFSTEKAWKYKGSTPCIVDFYATWCGPCKMIAPTLADLAKKYDGKIIIYKVDVDAEKEVSMAFGIQSIPSLLFIPASGEPRMEKGLLSQEALEEIINKTLLTQKL